MKPLFAAAAVTAAFASAANAEPSAVKPFKVALLCIRAGEQDAGLNKICYYDCAGWKTAITISASRICPVHIEY
jgi:hypothetical protein